MDTVPVVHNFQGFERFGRIHGTMWDVRIDYVQCERQGIFLNSGTKTVVVICALEFLERMQFAFEEFLSIQPEVCTTYEAIRTTDTVRLGTAPSCSSSGAKMKCEVTIF